VARGRKFIPIDLPDYRKEQELENMSPFDVRVAFLRKGFNTAKEVSAREWPEKQLTLQSLYSVLDPYIPPKQALPIFPGITSPSTQLKAKSTEIKQRIKHRWHSYFSGTRKIKKKEGFKKFQVGEFLHRSRANLHQCLYRSCRTQQRPSSWIDYRICL